MVGKSWPKVVNDQYEQLGIGYPGLLTFDNAARSSQPSQESAPCARAESRKGTGEPHLGVNRTSTAVRHGGFTRVGDLPAPNPSANPVGEKEGKEHAHV